MLRNPALLAIVAAFGLLFAGLFAGSRGDLAAAQESLTLSEHVTDEQVVDLGDEGDTVGDALVHRPTNLATFG